jgi:DNA repair protein RadA/Sms
VFGEIGLTGELRAVGQPERRLTEATRVGFETVYMPRGDVDRIRGAGRAAVGVASLRDAVAGVLTSPED